MMKMSILEIMISFLKSKTTNKIVNFSNRTNTNNKTRR